MNYLAHSFLAPDPREYPLVFAGNYAGDLVKGSLKDSPLHPDLKFGIRLHRTIDSYTDRHKGILNLRPLFKSGRGRFLGIVADISFDHLLTRYWNEFSIIQLKTHIKNSYQTIENCSSQFPEPIQKSLGRMIYWDLLGSYADIDGVVASVNRVARRLKPGNLLEGAGEELRLHYNAFEDCFFTLMPELIQVYEKYMEEYKVSLARMGYI
jgi:acyl carrier protein phosphodiesterase